MGNVPIMALPRNTVFNSSKAAAFYIIENIKFHAGRTCDTGERNRI